MSNTRAAKTEQELKIDECKVAHKKRMQLINFMAISNKWEEMNAARINLTHRCEHADPLEVIFLELEVHQIDMLFEFDETGIELKKLIYDELAPDQILLLESYDMLRKANRVSISSRKNEESKSPRKTVAVAKEKPDEVKKVAKISQNISNKSKDNEKDFFTNIDNNVDSEIDEEDENEVFLSSKPIQNIPKYGEFAFDTYNALDSCIKKAYSEKTYNRLIRIANEMPSIKKSDINWFIESEKRGYKNTFTDPKTRKTEPAYSPLKKPFTFDEELTSKEQLSSNYEEIYIRRRAWCCWVSNVLEDYPVVLKDFLKLFPRTYFAHIRNKCLNKVNQVNNSDERSQWECAVRLWDEMDLIKGIFTMMAACPYLFSSQYPGDETMEQYKHATW